MSLIASAVSAGGLFSRGSDDTIWRSGPHSYVKYGSQDNASTGLNDHPVELTPSEVTAALESLRFWTGSYFSTTEDEVPVFSVLQARQLAAQLARGLREAQPEQDIEFALLKTDTKLLLLESRLVIAGRAFYKNDRLNIIIGEYDKGVSKELDRVYDSSGQVTLYTYSHGSRSSDSGRFKGNLVTMPGVENRNLGNTLRQDWFVIDVPVAAEAFIAQRENRNRGPEGANMQAIREEAAKYAAERRQMRIEMARMRKEMAERGSNADSSVEERLERLQELRERELISAEEYEKKRQEILADI